MIRTRYDDCLLHSFTSLLSPLIRLNSEDSPWLRLTHRWVNIPPDLAVIVAIAFSSLGIGCIYSAALTGSAFTFLTHTVDLLAVVVRVHAVVTPSLLDHHLLGILMGGRDMRDRDVVPIAVVRNVAGLPVVKGGREFHVRYVDE